ncbi:hypothetical protein B0H14DRAFT_1492575 [Mycena olivaceomarginata]|nr:hypothetical protein B0H14DRAFT_1492575 [Mycena olivaceomarginata]
MYRGRIFGRQDPMTVVVSDDPEFERRKAEVEAHQRYRHPFLAQLFGFTCTAGLNVFIYHDEMMPISQVEEMHAGSILARRYVRYVMKQNFNAADSFWKETTGWSVLRLLGTAWIRQSTGKLCLNIGDGYQSYMRIFSIPPNMRKLPSFKLTENDMHNKLLSTLELDRFYTLPIPSIWSRHGLLSSTTGSVALPSVCITPDRRADRKFNWNELTPIHFTNFHLSLSDVVLNSWHRRLHLPIEVLSTGWTRIEYSQTSYSNEFDMKLELNNQEDVVEWWLSQQNYVHKCLAISRIERDFFLSPRSPSHAH